MSSISKRFPGVVALDRVDVDVASGEIAALVGENGAGKSTLMKILAGIHRPDSGELRLEGTPVVVRGPLDAARRGIAVIHQERELIDTLDVAGNVFLGREPSRGGPFRLLDRRRMHADTAQQLARMSLTLSPSTIVGHLSAAQQQFVAIARALSMNARLLILDEPTSSLTTRDAERLFAVLRGLRAAGTAIIYISHRLKEVEALADRAIVLRDGKNAGTLPRAALTRDHLVRLMVGRTLDAAGPPVRVAVRPPPPSPGPRRDDGEANAVLRLERLRTARFPDAEVSLAVHRGEVLGIAGLIGAGRTELAEAMCGVHPPVSGRVLLDDDVLTIASPREAIRRGICLVPEDRRRSGVIGPMTIRDNVTLPTLASYARMGLIARTAEAAAARRVTTALTVKAPSIETTVATLSGGNQQKVVLAKWLAQRPRVIVFDEPTQGVDVGAKAEIHRLIRGLADEGTAVVMISSDMEELVAESDRVAVMREGYVTGILARASCTPEAIMQLALA
jgi:ribose transport system ATP-binding protein